MTASCWVQFVNHVSAALGFVDSSELMLDLCWHVDVVDATRLYVADVCACDV